MSKRAEEFAQKEYPLGFSGAEILPWRMGLKEGYEQAEKDILELIESRIKSIGSNRERGYWLDATSELEDIIDLIKD